MNLIIEEIKSIDEHLDQLSELLVKVVEGGASIGFLEAGRIPNYA
jgi:hypothetical protein